MVTKCGLNTEPLDLESDTLTLSHHAPQYLIMADEVKSFTQTPNIKILHVAIT